VDLNSQFANASPLRPLAKFKHARARGMNPNETPLSEAEREQLRKIRERRANRNARREIANDGYVQNYFKGMFSILGILALLAWPAFVWHGPLNVADSYTLTRAPWTALAIWWFCVGVVGLLCRKNVRQKRTSSKVLANRSTALKGHTLCLDCIYTGCGQGMSGMVNWTSSASRCDCRKHH
jgi:hypothetical protein